MVLVQFVAVTVLLSHAVCVEVVLLQDMAVVVVDIYSMFACLFLLTICYTRTSFTFCFIFNGVFHSFSLIYMMLLLLLERVTIVLY